MTSFELIQTGTKKKIKVYISLAARIKHLYFKKPFKLFVKENYQLNLAIKKYIFQRGSSCCGSNKRQNPTKRIE